MAPDVPGRPMKRTRSAPDSHPTCTRPATNGTQPAPNRTRPAPGRTPHGDGTGRLQGNGAQLAPDLHLVDTQPATAMGLADTRTGPMRRQASTRSVVEFLRFDWAFGSRFADDQYLADPGSAPTIAERNRSTAIFVSDISDCNCRRNRRYTCNAAPLARNVGAPSRD